MKIKYFAAFTAVITLILIASCSWFKSKKTNGDPLSGKWQLDSIVPGKDSNLVIFMALASMQKDSSPIDFQFKKDTLLTFSNNDVDTALYHYKEAEQQVIVSDNTGDETFNFKMINDSTLSLMMKDSSLLLLRKQR